MPLLKKIISKSVRGLFVSSNYIYFNKIQECGREEITLSFCNAIWPANNKSLLN